LPHDPSLDPGLSSMGYLDYGAPLFLTKPSRVTIGNWYTMASTIFGASASWPIGVTYGAPPQVDNAVLTEFPSVSIPAGKMVEAGRTSYGTGEYEKCVGSLLSLVFYPEHVVWTKSNTPPPGFYTPNPIHIEKFVLNPDKVNSSANTKITLMVGDDMTISDSLCKANFGRSKTKPDSGAGVFLGPGDVAYFDWWACVSPAQFCTGPDIDSLKFTATCGICPPGFLNQNGDMQCDMTITIDCAEADIDAPEFSDTLVVHDSAGLNVHDWRTTDRGLASITWAASPGTDTSEIKVIPPSPAIGPCFTDKVNHIVKVVQLDSTVGGCYDFTFTDCLGHQSYHTVCMTAEIRRYPDSLPPLFTLLTHAGRPDTVWCTSIIDSFEVSDARVHDSGMSTLEVMPGSAQNMILVTAPIVAGDPVVRFSVHVLDSTQPGSICIRATDCSKEAHFADTCIQYCPLVLTGVAVAGSKALSLEANPNPFTHGTTFRYSVGRNGIVRLILYDELGREVARIADGMRAQGAYSIEFDGSNLPAGSYIVRLENGGNILSRKVVIER
ncbi:MAG: T9SS type A sorting domain-containing protein, partial [Bacteroidota bacterium]|nr:T9SS type A sorting domain-containing protein [Bacteroidota bacterium]